MQVLEDIEVMISYFHCFSNTFLIFNYVGPLSTTLNLIMPKVNNEKLFKISVQLSI